jgi:TusA-related sulfurtransferase
MNNNLDMRGYSCPIPLLRTREALMGCDELTVLIDEPAARENILKYSASQHYKAECTDGNGEWTLHIVK